MAKGATTPVPADTTSDTVATTEPVEGTLVPSNAYPKLRQMLDILRLESAQSNRGSEFVMEIMERILAAESFEQIFAEQESGMVSGKDFAGRPFLLHGDNIEVMPSRFESLPFYFLLKVTALDTGEEVVLNCGGMTFVATLHGLRQNGYFENPEYPDGRTLVLSATPSPQGAYLSLRPYVVKTSGRAKN